MLLAGAIFVLTIVLVIWQPKGLGIGWSATLGAILALLCGVSARGRYSRCVEYRLECDRHVYCGHYYQPAAR